MSVPPRIGPRSRDSQSTHRIAGHDRPMSLLLDQPATRPPGREPRAPARRPSVVVLVLAALAGGAAGAGALAATGALDRGAATTTVVQRSTIDVARTATGRLDAGAIYAVAAPGTVDITSRGTATTAQGPFEQPQASQSTATGSGFVLDGKGHIVTAAHVVEGATSITVQLQDGTSRTAQVLGSDNATDIAVLKIDASGLTLHPLALGSSASLGVGDDVAALGDPFEFDRSISTGIVSGLDRTIEAPNGFTVAHAIQTDSALNPGNSGGPLLDSRGRVIGIVDQIATDGSSQQSSGVGFAVPIDLVAKELAQLVAGGTVAHAYLGVSTSDATRSGALVAQIAASGPAGTAGLKAGDVVTKIGGTSIGGTSDLVAAIADHDPGDAVALTVLRGSATLHLTVTLGTQPTQRSQTIG